MNHTIKGTKRNINSFHLSIKKFISGEYALHLNSDN